MHASISTPHVKPHPLFVTQNHVLVEGRFGSHRVENIYREEQLKMVKLLNSNLDQLSLAGSTINPQEKKRK